MLRLLNHKYCFTSGGKLSHLLVCMIQDTALPLKLIQKLGILTGIMEMSQACVVPVEWILLRGQGVRIWSQLCLVSFITSSSAVPQHTQTVVPDRLFLTSLEVTLL